MLLGLNSDPSCTVALSKDEVLSVTEVIEHDTKGKAINLMTGEWVGVRNGAAGNIRFSTSGTGSCTMSLLVSEHEPHVVLEALLDVGTS